MKKESKPQQDKPDAFIFAKSDIIRRIRYMDATIVNLSTENKDVTFRASNPSAHNDKKQVTKWASYTKKQVEETLQRAIDENITLNLLVHRRRVTYKKVDDPKVKDYEMHDFVESAFFVD